MSTSWIRRKKLRFRGDGLSDEDAIEGDTSDPLEIERGATNRVAIVGDAKHGSESKDGAVDRFEIDRSIDPALPTEDMASTHMTRWHPLTTGSAAFSIALLAALPWCCGYHVGAPVLALLLSGLLVAGVSPQALPTWARVTAASWLPLTVSLFVVHGLFTYEGVNAVASIGPYDVTLEGLTIAWSFAGRLLIVIAATASALVIVPADDAVAVLTSLRVPPDIALVLQVALNTMPTARRRAVAIRDAQRARGLETGGGLLARLRTGPALVSPLALGLLLDGETRAIALELRGARMRGPRVRLRDLPDSDLQRLFRRLLPLIALALISAAHVQAR